MTLSARGLTYAALVAGLAACSFDTGLPSVPQAAVVTGVLDTGSVSPVGRAVTLIDENGQKVSVDSGANGVFLFPSVQPGLYVIDVRVQGFAPLLVPNVRVKSAQTVDVGTLTLFRLDGQTLPSGSLTLLGTLADGVTTSSELTAMSSVRVTFTTTNVTEYFLGDETLTACPSTGYSPLPSSGSVTTQLAPGAPGPREVRACLRDANGNAVGNVVNGAWAPSATITFDSTAPSGCSLDVQGKARNGDPSPVAGFTALTNISVRVHDCLEAPADMAIVIGGVSCTPTASLVWQRYAPDPVSFQLPNQDGLQQLNVCVRDRAMNTALATTSQPGATITLDTAPPITPFLTIATHNNSGQVNTASVTVSGGALGAATWGVAESPAVTPSLAFTAPSAATSVALSAGDGTKTLYAVFADELGNTSQPVSANVVLDTQPPTTPVMNSVEFLNRGARAFWSPATDNSGIGGYALYCDLTADAGACATTGPDATDALMLGFENRTAMFVSIRAEDLAGNLSPASQSTRGVTGLRNLVLPYTSAYPVMPLDVAIRGNDVFVTFSERDYSWSSFTGNLKVAVSHDLGQTWTVTSLDETFTSGRLLGRIALGNQRAYIGTVTGVTADISGRLIRGQVRLYSTANNGNSWSFTYLSPSADGQLALTDSLELSARDDQFTAYFMEGLGGDLRLLRSNDTGTAWTLVGGATNTEYYVTGNEDAAHFAGCIGNSGSVVAWQPNVSGHLSVLTSYFSGASTAQTAAGEAAFQDLTSAGTFSSFDLACAAQPNSTNVYLAVTGDPPSNGAAVSLRVLRKTSLMSSFSGTGTSLSVNVDSSVHPRIWASGHNVFAVYRGFGSALVLQESNDDGVTFPTNKQTLIDTSSDARGVVLSGNNSEDLAIAYTDATGSGISLFLPASPAPDAHVRDDNSGTQLVWAPIAGVNMYEMASASSWGGPWSAAYDPVPPYDVPATSPWAPKYYQVRSIDEQGLPGNNNEVWQVEPPHLEFPAGFSLNFYDAGTASGSASAGLAALDGQILYLPPQAADTPALRIYQYDGTTWTPQDTGITTSGARSLAQANRGAALFYKLSSTTGLRMRTFSSLTAPISTETLIDSSAGVTLVAARNNAVVWGDTTNDRVRVGLLRLDGGTVLDVAPTYLSVPSAGVNTTLGAVQILRTTGTSATIAWRQHTNLDGGTAAESIYGSDVTFNGSAWSYSTPRLLATGIDSTSGDPATDYAVSATANLAGGMNSQATVLAYYGDTSVSQTIAGHLSVTTGAPMLGTGTGFSRVVNDYEPGDPMQVAGMATEDGFYLAYPSYDATSGDRHLKFSYCAFNCSSVTNWHRSSLESMPGDPLLGIGGTGDPTFAAPVMTLDQPSDGGVPSYVLGYIWPFFGSNQLRVLRGGVHRWAH